MVHFFDVVLLIGKVRVLQSPLYVASLDFSLIIPRTAISQKMFRRELRDDEPHICTITKVLCRCQRSSNQPLRYVRSFLRPACKDDARVNLLVVLYSMFLILNVSFLIWDAAVYPYAFKDAKWSHHDADPFPFVLKPTTWLSFATIVMLWSLIRASWYTYDSKDNPNPPIEPTCEHTPLYLRIWNLYIVTRHCGMMSFIIFMHDVQFFDHTDPGEKASVVMQWVTIMTMFLVGAFPYHLRDMFISQFVFGCVVLYVVMLSYFDTQLYAFLNFHIHPGQSWRVVLIYTVISLSVDLLVIIVGKIKNAVLRVDCYSPPITSVDHGATMLSTL